MKQGKCTNLPSECELADSQELQMIPSEDTRCRECGSLLMASSSNNNNNGKIIKYAVIALVGIFILGGIGVAAYNYFSFDESSVKDNHVELQDDKHNDSKEDQIKDTVEDKKSEDDEIKVQDSDIVSAPAAKPSNIALDIQGSNTIGSELMPKLLEAYYTKTGSKLNDEIEEALDERKFILEDKRNQVFAVNLASHGSSTGFKALVSGEADLAMSSRKIKPNEAKMLKNKGLGDMESPSQEFVIGIDGIAVIVHQSNPIDEISVADLKKIFSGEYKNWSQLGGTHQPINLYVRDENSGTRDTFNSLVMHKTEVLNSAKAFEDSNALSSSVSADPSGIGYIGLPYVNSAKALSVSDGAAIALKPSSFTLSTEDYPLTRRLYLYIPLNATPAARELANFAVESEGQQIVEQTGFIGQEAKAQRISADSDFSAPDVIHKNSGYKSLFENAERINTNFRFAFNSTKLDNKAKQDLSRVTTLLDDKTKRGENYRLVLVGFTDNRGAECINNAVSLKRARIVANELATFGVKADIVEGMGSEAPVADNHTDLGREKNRRVELWLAPLNELPKFPIKQVCE